MSAPYVDIHTHRPTGLHIEPRAEGIHPWQADLFGDAPADPPPGTDALGEIGLDYARDVDRARQERLLRAQLAQARRLRLPVVIHCVKAFEPLMAILGEYDLRAVIFHGFIGSPEQAAQALRRGYYLSFGERSLRSPRTCRALRATPLGSLFFETDDGDTPIEAIYRAAAEAMQCPTEELRASVYENYRRIFFPHP